jgi:hypothetical protein
MIARRKVRKAFSEARVSRSFSKLLVAHREPTEIFGKVHHGFCHHHAEVGVWHWVIQSVETSVPDDEQPEVLWEKED